MSLVTTIRSGNRVQIYSIILSNVQKTIKYSKNSLIFANYSIITIDFCKYLATIYNLLTP